MLQPERNIKPRCDTAVQSGHALWYIQPFKKGSGSVKRKEYISAKTNRKKGGTK